MVLLQRETPALSPAPGHFRPWELGLEEVSFGLEEEGRSGARSFIHGFFVEMVGRERRSSRLRVINCHSRKLTAAILTTPLRKIIKHVAGAVPFPCPNTSTASSPTTAAPAQKPPPDILLIVSPFDPIASAARLLWGRSLLPPSNLRRPLLLVRRLAPHDAPARPLLSRRLLLPARLPFPHRPLRIPPPPHSGYPHLHLYAALPCPWAHRALIVRALRSLETAIPLSLASPGRDASWEFRPADAVNDRRTLREIYALRPGGYDGRSTVPMLWDSQIRDVVCNESYAIIEFFNEVGSGGDDLAPPHLRPEIGEWNRIIHPGINNGVYRCGFAQSQEAYDAAVDELFSAMDTVEEHLSASRYLCGDTFTLADVCLFTTLIRFDLAYNILFRCSKRKLVEYPNLHGYTREIYQMPKIAATCDFGAIVDSYYGSLFPLNPSGIRPATPASASEVELLSKLHCRESISLRSRDAATKAV
ncbi:hypothetical protein KSP40_PGU013178 [Platanthera guangdongensis]|uniref:GST C-terminal domain-containing protein n=1 Tax=Platanthera guangdongensis TaxID=2320717 RepID=A0ABR2LNC3_9ASPA